MNGKVIPFHVQSPVADEKDVLWVIGVSRNFEDSYFCKYRVEEGLWSIHVESSTFAGAEVLVKQCRCMMGWNQSTDSKEGAI